MFNHTWFSYFKCMGGSYTKNTKKGIISDIWNWSCIQMWTNVASGSQQVCWKRKQLLTSMPALWSPQNLFVMRYGINYYEPWPFPCSMLILFLSNWIPFLTFLEFLILYSIILQAQQLSSIQILWTAGIPSTESLLTIISMQFCPESSGLGVGAQRGARESGLGKGKGPLSL